MAVCTLSSGENVITLDLSSIISPMGSFLRSSILSMMVLSWQLKIVIVKQSKLIKAKEAQ